MNEAQSDTPQQIDKSNPVTPPGQSSSSSPGVPDSTDDSLATDSMTMPRSRLLMSRETTALLVIDVQEKLVPYIQSQATLLWNIRRLIDGASVLNVLTTCTEQYPKGLGSTVPLIADRVKVEDEKLLFSCRDCRNVVDRLRRENRHQVLLCGIETHVCVQQTALDLISMGFDVWVAVDAVSSRFSLDHQTALRRMEMSGAILTTTESALFEWCEVAGTHEFKRVSTLVRELAPTRVDVLDPRHFPRSGSRYIVQSDHRETSRANNAVVFELHNLVRSTDSGAVVQEYRGKVTRQIDDPTNIISKEGTQAVEVTPDGTAISVQDADDSIEMVYLAIGDPRTNHPRWKVRRDERHINSEQYKHDYEIRIQVVDYKTDDTYREFVGYEHRDPEGGGFTHVSGVRQIEISSDGRWMVVTEIGRPPELVELPPEK